MAEPVVVEFKLTPDEAASLLQHGGQISRAKRNLAVIAALTVLAIVLGAVYHNKGLQNLGIIMAAVSVLGVVVIARTPKIHHATAARMAGQTRVTLSDQGIEYSGATVAERIPWSRVRRLADRPDVWAILTEPPVTSYYIPKSAVPTNQREHFTHQLITWSGDSFKFRKR